VTDANFGQCGESKGRSILGIYYTCPHESFNY
jgi:hypothetical protein